MKISYNWLKEYIETNETPQHISELLTNCGLEVEGLEEVASVRGSLEGVVIGQVSQKEKHPNADKLSLTKVRINENTVLDIVCGAPNVEAGQKVLVATVGAKIYTQEDSFTIKKTKIRGAVSEGMICSEKELGLGEAEDGIMVLPADAPVGNAAADYFNIEKDWVFEIGLTPNRADAAFHMGVARDLAAVINNKNNYKNGKTVSYKPLNSIDFDNFPKTQSKPISITIEDTNACKRYAGILIKNITVKPSPEWLQNKLKFIGLKPHNNIVDISNYLLFAYGQPLHIFDADAIKGQKVLVKKYDHNFDFTTLDGADHKLTPDDLMICNADGPMCIAGIYGGLNSGVTHQTKNIFIESAYFNPIDIRKTAKRLGLKTDSSFRFERGTDPNIAVKVLQKATAVILENAGGQIASDVIDVYPAPVEPLYVDFKYNNFYKISGSSISHEHIKNILNDLEIKILKENNDGLQITIPPYRVDVTREIDVIEEVMRIYGFNNIALPQKVNASATHFPKNNYEAVIQKFSDYLSHNGYIEIMNNSLTKYDYYKDHNFFDIEKCVRILNPLSKDLEMMRRSLIYGALEVVLHNINRNISDMKLFEVGKSYSHNKLEKGLEKYQEAYNFMLLHTGKQYKESWQKPETPHDFFSLKSELNKTLKGLGIDILKIKTSDNVPEFFDYGLSYIYKDAVLAHFGCISSKVLKYFDIKQDVFYAELYGAQLIQVINDSTFVYKEASKYPAMRRDLALLIDNKTRFIEIEEMARNQNIKQLQSINLFDIYKGENIPDGKKSYAVSFTFQDDNRTLTDKEVDKIMKSLMQLYQKKINAVIR